MMRSIHHMAVHRVHLLRLPGLLMALVLLWGTPLMADDSPRYQVVDGVRIYIGILPMAMVGEKTPDMHGATPGAGSFHLVAALFDEKSGDRISNAKLTASLTGADADVSKKLEPMSMNNVASYGNFFMFPGLGEYGVRVEAVLPGNDQVIQANFSLSFVRSDQEAGHSPVPDFIRKSAPGSRSYDYGFWTVMIINAAVFIIFALSFTRPKSWRDWRSLGAFSAFIVALFAEMYGFPLTIYLLSGWLTSHYPELNLYAHGTGHLWSSLLGFEGDPHADPMHILSNLLIFGGFFMLASAWKVLHRAQQQHALATSGLYARIRHPQYDAFIIIMTGFLLQWPTILTLLMYPILVWMYIRLARQEERSAIEEFGEEYRQYMAQVPAFIPRRNKQGGLQWKV